MTEPKISITMMSKIFYAFIYLLILGWQLHVLLKVSRSFQLPHLSLKNNVKMSDELEKLAILQNLQQQDFFKYIQVNTNNLCQFYPPDEQCNTYLCLIEELSKKDLPQSLILQPSILKDQENSDFEKLFTPIFNEQADGSYYNIEKFPESFTDFQGKNI